MQEDVSGWRRSGWDCGRGEVFATMMLGRRRAGESGRVLGSKYMGDGRGLPFLEEEEREGAGDGVSITLAGIGGGEG